MRLADLLRVLLFEGVLLIVLFGSAGRWDLPWFWAVLAVHASVLTIGASRIDPDLAKERRRAGGADRDRPFRATVMPFLLAQLVIAGLDAGRFHWTEAMPVSVRCLGLVGLAVGMSWSFWAMAVNRFFSAAVRIQSERGHQVIRSGPYQWVRHPGYLGMLVSTPCLSLALGSWYSLWPLLVVICLFVRRVTREDRMLLQELDGYRDYAQQVRSRLIPGLW